MTAYCRLPVTIRGGPVPTTGNHPRRPSAGFRSPCHNGPTADYRQPSEMVQWRLPVTVRLRPSAGFGAPSECGPEPASGHRAPSGGGSQPKFGYQIPVTDECKIRLSSTALVRRPCSKANTVNHLYCWRWQPVWKQFSDRDNNFTKCLWEKRNQCCWTERRANFIVSSNM